MELLDLSVPLLTSTASFLESTGLAKLDSAVCNHQTRSSLLDAFAHCHTTYGDYCVVSDTYHIAWLIKRKFKIASIHVNDENSSFFAGKGVPCDFWPLLTSESALSIALDVFDVFGVFSTLPRLKSLHCSTSIDDSVDANCVSKFASTTHTAVTVSYKEIGNGSELIQYLSDRRFDHLLSEISVVSPICRLKILT